LEHAIKEPSILQSFLITAVHTGRKSFFRASVKRVPPRHHPDPSASAFFHHNGTGFDLIVRNVGVELVEVSDHCLNSRLFRMSDELGYLIEVFSEQDHLGYNTSSTNSGVTSEILPHSVECIQSLDALVCFSRPCVHTDVHTLQARGYDSYNRFREYDCICVKGLGYAGLVEKCRYFREFWI
jgi:hypothetical protein